MRVEESNLELIGNQITRFRRRRTFWEARIEELSRLPLPPELPDPGRQNREAV